MKLNMFLIVGYTVWEDGQTGSVTGFSQNGSTSENYRILGSDPEVRKQLYGKRDRMKQVDLMVVGIVLNLI